MAELVDAPDSKGGALSPAKPRGCLLSEEHHPMPDVKAAVLAALFLTACTTPPHTPERDGVWITKPREMVRCWETKEGVVCRSDRVIQAESLGN